MNFTALLDKLDDRLNPIVVKELRQAVKSRMVVGILLLFLGLQLFMLGFVLLVREGSGDVNTDWNAGNRVFQIQHGILLWTIMILVPAYAAIRLAAERADQNVDLMFISTLRPISIVWGKFFAAVVLGLLIFSACAPFMTFTYLLRGIDIPTILVVLGADLLAMLYGVMLALFLASIPGGRAVKFFFCFIGFIMLAYQCAMLTGGTVMMIEFGGSLDRLSEGWVIVTVGVAGVLGGIGLMSFYCVAMISPPSSNRIFPLRLFLFITWVGMSVGFFLASYHYPPGVSLWPIVVYMVTFCPILHVQFLISIGERDQWGHRVARTIPRRWYLRPLAWLFYTGAGGGVTYTLFLLTATLASSAAWIEYYGTFAPGMGVEVTVTMLRVELILSLYVLCYGLSAVLVRNYLMADQIKSSMNWLVGLLLLGLGSSIPTVIAYITDQMRSQPDVGWWALPNPFLAMYEVGQERWGHSFNNFETMLYWFLTVWAVLVAVLSLPWYGAQIRRFRPPHKRAGEMPSIVPVEALAGAGPVGRPVLETVAVGELDLEPAPAGDQVLKDRVTARRPGEGQER